MDEQIFGRVHQHRSLDWPGVSYERVGELRVAGADRLRRCLGSLLPLLALVRPPRQLSLATLLPPGRQSPATRRTEVHSIDRALHFDCAPADQLAGP